MWYSTQFIMQRYFWPTLIFPLYKICSQNTGPNIFSTYCTEYVLNVQLVIYTQSLCATSTCFSLDNSTIVYKYIRKKTIWYTFSQQMNLEGRAKVSIQQRMCVCYSLPFDRQEHENKPRCSHSTRNSMAGCASGFHWAQHIFHAHKQTNAPNENKTAKCIIYAWFYEI